MAAAPHLASLPTRVRASPSLNVLGRVGYSARAVVFTMLGVLVVLTSLGLARSKNDPVGALEQLARAPFGGALTGLVGIGLSAYVAWNVVVGLASCASAWKRRRPGRVAIGLGYVLTGACYAPLAWASGELAFGRPTGPALHFGGLFAAEHGRILVGALGGALVVAALVQVVIGTARTFTEPLDLARVPSRRRRALVGLGVIGFLARGALFALVAGFAIRASHLAAPSDAHGPDGALELVLTMPHGAWALLPLGLGLVAFGAFSLLAVRHLRG
jgi:hypothetical protein